MKATNPIGLFLAICIFAALGAMILSIVPDFRPKNHASILDPKTGSKLVTLGRIKILIDDGMSQDNVQNVEKVLGEGDTYIDIGIITSPKSQYFGGFQTLFTKFQFGALIYNGRDPLNGSPDEAAWKSLMKVIKSKNIPLVTLGAGDNIRYGKARLAVGAPGKDAARSPNIDETALILRSSGL